MDSTRPREIAMPETEEIEFVRAAQRGDRVAFLALARWHWPWVVPLVEALCPRERVAARTLEVFEHAWRGLHFLPEGQRFFVWIHRIAFNLCLAVSPGPEPRGAEKRGESALSGAADDLVLPLARAFPELTAEHQQVLLLRHALGLSLEDTARMLEVTPRTARERLSGARADLYTRLAKRDSATLRHFTLAQLCDYVGTDPLM